MNALRVFPIRLSAQCNPLVFEYVRLWVVHWCIGTCMQLLYPLLND